VSELVDASTRDVIDGYTARASQYAQRADEAARLDRRIAVARLAAFAVAALTIIGVVEGQISQAIGDPLAIVVLLVFAGLLGWHNRVKDRVRTWRALERRCRDGVNRVRRTWDALPLPPHPSVPPDHAFASDLHLIGSHSLARLLAPASGAAGIDVLRSWLLAEVPPDVETITTRQRAVRELAPRAEWRDLLTVLAGRLAATRESAAEFVVWAESSAPTPVSRAVVWIGRVLTGATILSIAAEVAHVVSLRVPAAAIGANVVFGLFLSRRLARALESVAGHDAGLRGLGELLHHVADAGFETPELTSLATQLGGRESARAFARFDRLATMAEVRLSPMGHIAVQALVLWDVHLVDALDAWRRRHGSRVRSWLRALGEVEALSALATLAHDNPAWAFPEVVASASASLDAENLAHPLLPKEGRVGNDVHVGPPGEILFITGSNMAGKSTLLRAIGLNIVLAQAGAPVCAGRMTLVRARLRTSIDVADALERGLSLYMSELLRIRAIVEAAREESDCRLFFLADEMLRGTNAVDRHSAIVTIMASLIDAGAVGAVATHDSTLAMDERLRSHLQLVHFVEQFRDGNAERASSMWFDYRLRLGLSTSRNALKLLELVGLGGSMDRA